ncbi:hypothetical protein N824_02190 [Pedobacter sp. V48]|nr:hypothetical protein N824_02190 [Pedobacter sp. V48]
MSLIAYFKEITIGWKLSLFIIVFCIWPICAYLIFHFEPGLFTSIDLFKLISLSSAIASPFMILNTLVSFLLTYPKDKELMSATTPDQLFSGTVLAGVGLTFWVLFFGAIAALLEFPLLNVKLTILGIELAVIIVIGWSKLLEDRRFKRKRLKAASK